MLKFMVFDAYGFRQKDITAKSYTEALTVAKRTIHAPMLESYNDFRERTQAKEMVGQSD